MLIAGGAIIAIGIAALVMSGGSDGSNTSGSKMTSYTSSGESASSHHSLSVGNPASQNSTKSIENETVKTTAETLIDFMKDSLYKNENNPGIDICKFNNGNAQCQSASVLQSLIGIKTGPLINYNLHQLVSDIKAEKGNSVSIKNFIKDFANKNLGNQSKDDNPLHYQYETFITGKTVDKNSNGHGVATTKTSPKIASATDYMTALMSLFEVNEDEYCVKYHNKFADTGFMLKKMPALISTTFPKKDKFNTITSLNELILETFKQDNSFGGIEGIPAPNYVFFSTESMLPAEILYVLTNWTNNGSTTLFDANYRIKSMVCRRTDKKLLTTGDMQKINTSGATHFVCVQNDYKNKKFIEIDSLSPGQIKSCSNDNIVNFIKNENGSYNIPVIIIFEKELIADAENINPAINHHVQDNIPNAEYNNNDLQDNIPNVEHNDNEHEDNHEDQLKEEVNIDENKWKDFYIKRWRVMRNDIYDQYGFYEEERNNHEFDEEPMYQHLRSLLGKSYVEFCTIANQVPKELNLEKRKAWLIDNAEKPIRKKITNK